jgi:hypothetical protein
MTNAKALERFVANKAKIDALLARIQGMSDDHFEVHPDLVHYGHVGDLANVAEKLQDISDSLFREGEYAA